jgi:uroporphyrin-III C-methyltransferase/precorrin-2 dehydrogenase/sirohydrochlorin ferrochelatase/uroporphyrin-III C-methyltransferase
VRFVPGHRHDGGRLDLDWSRLADPDTTLAIYMGLQSLAEIAANLIAAGLAPDTPAAAIEKGTTAGQRCLIGTLVSLPDLVRAADVQPPTLIVIGRVVSLASELDWVSQHEEQELDRYQESVISIG